MPAFATCQPRAPGIPLLAMSATDSPENDAGAGARRSPKLRLASIVCLLLWGAAFVTAAVFAVLLEATDWPGAGRAFMGTVFIFVALTWLAILIKGIYFRRLGWQIVWDRKGWFSRQASVVYEPEPAGRVWRKTVGLALLAGLSLVLAVLGYLGHIP